VSRSGTISFIIDARNTNYKLELPEGGSSLLAFLHSWQFYGGN
jgi:hypothetical protein